MVLCCLWLPGISAAQTPAETGDVQAPVASAETSKVKKDRVVCKRVKVTGTHFRKRICRKQSVWQQIERDSQRAMDELTRGRGVTGS